MTSNRAILTAITCAGAFAWSAGAAILRVDATALPGGDGSSWSRAFDSLTDALAAASSGDSLWVAGGQYTPELPAGRDATFQIPSGVQVYGGFDGNENSLAQRGDPLDPPSKLDGSISGVGAAYSVVTFIGAGSSTVLDGFFITGGIADGSGPSNGPGRNGGAIYADDSSPTLRNLFISECSADLRGGAIYLDGVTANFTNISDCIFLDNTSGSSGGAISVEVPVTIERCEFRGNQGSSGGALALRGGGVHTVADSEFRFNDAVVSQGGAILVIMDDAGSSFSVISGCEFRSNSAPFAGAVSYTNLGDHTIRSSRFLGNDATGTNSGAIRFDTLNASDTLLIENSLVTGNTSVVGGGGIFHDGFGDLHIVNCTIAENTSSNGGGGVAAAQGVTRIDNSIIWGNNDLSSAGQDNSIFTNLVGTLTVNRSIVQFLGSGDPAPAGVGAIAINPLFVDINGNDNTPGTPDDNARLMSGSPAIDRGNNLVLSPFVFSDIYADPRFIDDASTPDTGVPDGVNPIVDLGASEFPGEDPTSCNAADMAEPFGVLDFTDIVAFLSAFGAMDPAADLAAPFGVFDFSDVITFLGAFGAGCP